MRTEKRKADVGEKILIVEASPASDFIREGDIGEVTEDLDKYIVARIERSNERVVICHKEYEVITGDDMTDPPKCDLCEETLGEVACSNRYEGMFCSVRCADIAEREEDEKFAQAVEKQKPTADFEQDKMEVLLDELIEAIEVNSKKMKQEHEDGHDYAYLRYLQGKDQAYREILELIDGEVETDE